MKRVINFDDRAEVADWLAGLLERCYELADITTEATKPRQERTLSRAALRRETETVFAEIRKQARAARRGLRALGPIEPDTDTDHTPIP